MSFLKVLDVLFLKVSYKIGQKGQHKHSNNSPPAPNLLGDSTMSKSMLFVSGYDANFPGMFLIRNLSAKLGRGVSTSILIHLILYGLGDFHENSP